jgi:hypothetical protein
MASGVAQVIEHLPTSWRPQEQTSAPPKRIGIMTFGKLPVYKINLQK